MKQIPNGFEQRYDLIINGENKVAIFHHSSNSVPYYLFGEVIDGNIILEEIKNHIYDQVIEIDLREEK